MAGVVVAVAALGAASVEAQPAKSSPHAAASEIADFFGNVGNQIFEECIFELSAEQIEVQQALIRAYVEKGAAEKIARKLAVKQIQPPKLSSKCERIRKLPPSVLAPPAQEAAPAVPPAPPRNEVAKVEPKARPAPPAAGSAATPPAAPSPAAPAGPITLVDKKPLEIWDCAPDVDFVTIRHNGYDRKLTGGEICNPFEDVVHEVPDELLSFRLGYTISTGRLFVIAEGTILSGRTIAWGISGRDVCRNNPDPDCFATRAVGPLPPGEYNFPENKQQRVTWGPKTKRHVVAIYLSKLWNRDRFSQKHTAAILARGNIAIHVRLKGEMSEACIGLEPKGWAYVAGLIKAGRATGLSVYIDEPHPQIAEKPPVIAATTFSLSSLFKSNL